PTPQGRKPSISGASAPPTYSFGQPKLGSKSGFRLDGSSLVLYSFLKITGQQWGRRPWHTRGKRSKQLPIFGRHPLPTSPPIRTATSDSGRRSTPLHDGPALPSLMSSPTPL